MTRLTLVWAMAENGVIGRAGGLPWRLPDDLAHFREVTAGRPVLMGRRTWDSIGGRPLPGRRCLVLTRKAAARFPGAEAVTSLDQALELAGEPELVVAGGAEVYALALPRADRLWVTLVHASPPGDTHFPAVDWPSFELVEERRHPADQRHEHAFTIRRYERRG